MRMDEGSGDHHVSSTKSLHARTNDTSWTEAWLGSTTGLDTENQDAFIA
jgi:hypothetical protein